MSLFAPPEPIRTEVFAELPPGYRTRRERSVWADVNKGGQAIDCFLEGPAFDRAGNLYVVDIPWGRIFRIDPAGGTALVAEYDGEPNGLKIHRDGRIFVADYKNGVMLLDPVSGRVTPWCDRYRLERFKGCNDLTFASDGTMYFTDQGQTGHQDASGRVFRLAPDGRLDCLIDTIPSPNGIVLDRSERIVYVAVTRANAVWRMPLMADGGVSKVGTFIQLSGGLGGPDGLAMTDDGGLAVAHAGLGCVWVFDRLGQPRWRVVSCTGLFTTNVAFGGPDNRTLFVTESDTGTVLRAELPVAGRPLFSHQA
ncbi:MAG: SMP-30/gluconolactonase/LRE family protein [Alphaproteobacteria bacterium]